MKNIVYRKNKMFCIDRSKLSAKANKTDTIMALYSAIHNEFSGASYNDDYSNLTSLEKLTKVNEFANKWLNERGLL
jgi:hypothetical protein